MTPAQRAALEIAVRDAGRLLGATVPLQFTILRGLAEEAVRIARSDLLADRRPGPIRTVPGFPPPSPGDWADMPTPTRKYGSG
jgi:hypothetical protein